MIYLFVILLIWNPFLKGIVQKESLSYVQEELINTHTFTHEITIENKVKKERYTVDGTEVSPAEFEEQLSLAEKEERKKKRQQKQDEQFRLYEARYKGTVKLYQKKLLTVLTELESELNRLLDDRLIPFLVFPSEELSTEEQLRALKSKRCAQAKALIEQEPLSTDGAQLQKVVTSMERTLPVVKQTFIETVNNAIEKADDTKLLKELLTLF